MSTQEALLKQEIRLKMKVIKALETNSPLEEGVRDKLEEIHTILTNLIKPEINQQLRKNKLRIQDDEFRERLTSFLTLSAYLSRWPLNERETAYVISRAFQEEIHIMPEGADGTLISLLLKGIEFSHLDQKTIFNHIHKISLRTFVESNPEYKIHMIILLLKENPQLLNSIKTYVNTKYFLCQKGTHRERIKQYVENLNKVSILLEKIREFGNIENIEEEVKAEVSELIKRPLEELEKIESSHEDTWKKEIILLVREELKKMPSRIIRLEKNLLLDISDLTSRRESLRSLLMKEDFHPLPDEKLKLVVEYAMIKEIIHKCKTINRILTDGKSFYHPDKSVVMLLKTDVISWALFHVRKKDVEDELIKLVLDIPRLFLHYEKARERLEQVFEHVKIFVKDLELAKKHGLDVSKKALEHFLIHSNREHRDGHQKEELSLESAFLKLKEEIKNKIDHHYKGDVDAILRRLRKTSEFSELTSKLVTLFPHIPSLTKGIMMISALLRELEKRTTPRKWKNLVRHIENLVGSYFTTLILQLGEYPESTVNSFSSMNTEKFVYTSIPVLAFYLSFADSVAREGTFAYFDIEKDCLVIRAYFDVDFAKMTLLFFPFSSVMSYYYGSSQHVGYLDINDETAELGKRIYHRILERLKCKDEPHQGCEENRDGEGIDKDNAVQTTEGSLTAKENHQIPGPLFKEKTVRVNNVTYRIPNIFSEFR